jgi:hypothetical protein
MSRDALDELAAQLFEAAREEPVPRAALERAVRAAAQARASRPTRSRSRWAIGTGALALAAAAALALWRLTPRDEHGVAIVAEPPSAVVEPRAPVTQPAKSTPERVSAPSAAPIATTPVPRAPAPSAAAAPATLGDELEALKRAETALGSGDATAALAALDRYDRVVKGTKLRAEAALLRMDALKRTGRAAQAAELAARFVAENPGSPLVDRARSYLSAATPAASNSAAPAAP